MAWGSHLPVLLAAIGETNGAVLEMGIGHFSTPHLHAICGAQRRWLVSIEEDNKWFQNFVKYDSAHHEMCRLDYKAALDSMATTRWSVAFLDFSPGEKRADAFARLIGCSQFVVVHDYHREIEGAVKPLLADVNFHVATTYEPPTLVAAVTDIPASIRAF